MARTESVMRAGYYPLDAQGYDDLAAVLRPSSEWGHLSILDPCAGRGEVLRLARAMGDAYYAGVDWTTAYGCGHSPRNPAVDLRMCELESSRAVAAEQRWKDEDHEALAAWHEACADAASPLRRSRGFMRPVAAVVAEGDAFRLAVPSSPWATLLYLNPPYDHDDAKRGGRLEERWLERFSAFVVGDGVLAFVVPLAAVGACAPLLAQRWTDVQVGRVRAGAASAAFSPTQVVVLARRLRPDLIAPDGAAERRIRELVAAGVDALPGVVDLSPVVVPVTHQYPAREWEWKPQEIDYVGACAEYRPWHRSVRRAVPGAKRAAPLAPLREALPDGRPWSQLTAREYPTLMSLKPSYVADAIASGALDGELLEPHEAGLPAVYVKGMFDRKFREVEVKFDSNGEARASVQVQRPALRVSILDPAAGAVHVLCDSALPTGAASVDGFSVGDLVARYGPSLAAALGRRCPVTDDANGVEIPALRRPLFAAQVRAVRAIAGRLRRLLATRRRNGGRTPAVLLQGQPGTGKTSMCLATARTIGARRVLVICPPHLVSEEAAWQSDAVAVLGAGPVDDSPELGPGCDVRVLETPADVSRFEEDADDGRVRVGIASREVAKLGHGYEGLRKCPRCGAIDDRAPEKLASTRGRCKAPALRATGSRHLRRAAECLAVALAWALPDSAEVEERLPPGSFAARTRRRAKRAAGVGRAAARQAIDHVGRGVRSLRKKTLTESQSKNLDTLAGIADELRSALRGDASGAPHAGSRLLAALRGATPVRAAGAPRRTKDDGWRPGIECGEPLWQASARPRRWPLVRSLVVAAKRGAFDLLVLDEAHEYGNGDSAQAQAAEQLVACGVPTILATGTVCNGYMSSMHTHFRALSEDYARDFGRDDRPRAVARFGYQRRQVDLKAAADAPTTGGAEVELGAVSDRVVRGGVRVIGQAPGVLPEALLRYLAPATAQVHLEDLGEELPSITEHLIDVVPTDLQAAGLKYLAQELKDQIRADRKDKEKAGKLFGQFAELPSFLDRCVLAPTWTVSYPSPFGPPSGARGKGKSKKAAAERGPVVASLPHGTIGVPSPDEALPKETALVEWVAAQLRRGRPCLVYVWHWDLMPRVREALERGLAAAHLGCVDAGRWCPHDPETDRRLSPAEPARVSVMDPGKVAPPKRESWIAGEAKKRCAVLLTNPAAVKTGINSLARWWCSAAWYEGPGSSPEIRRQATHRLWRVGQRRPVEVASFVYVGTMQAAMHELLMRKVGVSEAVDGLDATAALAAAGVGEQDASASLEVGRALYEWCERAVG